MSAHITKAQRIRACVRKIGYQFADTPESNLMFAIVSQAAKDLTDKYGVIRRSAHEYVQNEIPHAEICGVSSDWIRETFIKGGVLNVN